MILIDTNVMSELWKAEPNPDVLAWVDAQTVETLYLSAITVAELRFGLATMPEARPRLPNCQGRSAQRLFSARSYPLQYR